VFACPDFRLSMKQFRHLEATFLILMLGAWIQLVNWVMLWTANASNLPSKMPWSHLIILHPPLWANVKSMKYVKNHPPTSTTHNNTKCATKQTPYYPWSYVVLSVFQILALKASAYWWCLVELNLWMNNKLGRSMFQVTTIPMVIITNGIS
jgi:hypothetical protein